MNPFTQVKSKKVKNASVAHVDVEMLDIGNDEFPGRRSTPEGKYAKLFETLKPGQCLKCEPRETQTLAQAMRKWINNTNRTKTMEVRAMSRFPKDGRGRVWLLEKESVLRKAA